MFPIEDGATIWARQTIQSDIFTNKPDKWFKIWFYLVNRMHFSDNEKLQRGQRFLKYEWISEVTKATKNQIDMFMRWAKKNQMLTTQKTTRGMVVTILNYNYYQTLDNYKTETETDLKTKQKRNRNDTILKNDKYVKNEKNKTLYGDFILLTEEEYQKLLKDFGQSNLKMMIEKLDNYLGADKKRIKKYTSHNHVLRGWVAERLELNKKTIQRDFGTCPKCARSNIDLPVNIQGIHYCLDCGRTLKT